MNKPKGIWVEGNRLWVTDIDVVWVFDLKTRKGKKLEIPCITFANDPAVVGSSLYVSDNRADRNSSDRTGGLPEPPEMPQVRIVLAAKSCINPTGVYPGKQGSLLVVGFMSPRSRRRVPHSSARTASRCQLAKDIGGLMASSSIRCRMVPYSLTDWNSGSLFRWKREVRDGNPHQGLWRPLDSGGRA